MPYRKWKGGKEKKQKERKKETTRLWKLLGVTALALATLTGRAQQDDETNRWQWKAIPLGRGTSGAVSHPSLCPLPVLTASSGLNRGQRVWIAKQSLSECVCPASLSESHLPHKVVWQAVRATWHLFLEGKLPSDWQDPTFPFPSVSF